MRQTHLTLLVAATLLSTAAQAQASVTQTGNVVMSVGFQASGVISASQFSSGSALSASPGATGGSISGAFFGPGSASSGVVDVTLSSASSPNSPRYAVPFLVATASTGALTPVPEPSGWVLMLVGAAGLAGWVRHRRA